MTSFTPTGCSLSTQQVRLHASSVSSSVGKVLRLRRKPEMAPPAALEQARCQRRSATSLAGTSSSTISRDIRSNRLHNIAPEAVGFIPMCCEPKRALRLQSFTKTVQLLFISYTWNRECHVSEFRYVRRNGTDLIQLSKFIPCSP
jgi:hypothetical protein